MSVPVSQLTVSLDVSVHKSVVIGQYVSCYSLSVSCQSSVNVWQLLVLRVSSEVSQSEVNHLSDQLGGQLVSDRSPVSYQRFVLNVIQLPSRGQPVSPGPTGFNMAAGHWHTYSLCPGATLAGGPKGLREVKDPAMPPPALVSPVLRGAGFWWLWPGRHSFTRSWPWAVG